MFLKSHARSHIQESTNNQYSPRPFSLKPIARLLSVGALGVGLGLSQSAHAATITVTSSNDIDNNCTLREALDSFAANALEPGCSMTGGFDVDDTIVFGGELAAGGTIPLSQGYLSLAANESVTINAPSNGVTVNGQSASQVMLVAGSASLTIDSLTITSGLGSNGAGIIVSEGASLTATNSTVSGNTANYGAGILALDNTAISIEDSSVSQNTASFGGGIAVLGGSGSSTLNLQDSTVQNNTAVMYGTSQGGAGGGILTFLDVEVTINETMVSGNTAIGIGGEFANSGGEGGGIAILSHSGKYATITNSQISNNVSSATPSNSFRAQGGGIFMTGVDDENLATLIVKYSSISNNTAASNGGGIGGEYFIVQAVNNTISNNTSSRSGGGIALSYSGMASINNSIISNNASLRGGGASLDSSSALIATSGSISNNTAGSNGGGIYFAAGSGSGDSASLFEDTINTVKYATVAGNSSGGRGGGIYLGGTGGPAGVPAKLGMLGSTLSGNRSGAESGGTTGGTGGGGLYMQSTSSLEMENSTVSGNRTSSINGGGGVQNIGGTASIMNSTFSDNKAGVTSNLKYGGAFMNFNGDVTVTNSIFANSNALNNCQNASGTFTIDAFSIVEGGGCGASRTGDPGLLPLRDNGGPTQTHLPREGSSIAINTGNNASCTDDDQRGEDRNIGSPGAICDVGSIEFLDSDKDQTSFYVIPLQNGKTVVIPL